MGTPGKAFLFRLFWLRLRTYYVEIGWPVRSCRPTRKLRGRLAPILPSSRVSNEPIRPHLLYRRIFGRLGSSFRSLNTNSLTPLPLLTLAATRTTDPRFCHLKALLLCLRAVVKFLLTQMGCSFLARTTMRTTPRHLTGKQCLRPQSSTNCIEG